jgi:hypothetical protein
MPRDESWLYPVRHDDGRDGGKFHDVVSAFRMAVVLNRRDRENDGEIPPNPAMVDAPTR